MTGQASPSSVNAPKYLVTGAAGFVGRHLITHLASQNVRLRAMVRSAAQAAELEPLVEDVVVADLTKPETLAPAVDGVAGVYHIAALFRSESADDSVFWDVNAHGVRNMLDAAIEAGVERFVHCSTNGVHSHIPNPPADETAPFNPGDLYQETKLEGEKIAMQYFEEGRIHGVVIRPTMIWGPGDRRTLKLFRMIAKRRFFYVGTGEALNHWVDVRDLANAFQLAMDARHLNAEAFLIGGREYIFIKELAQKIADQLNVPAPWLKLPVWPIMKLAYVCELICKPIGVEPPLFRRRVAFFLNDRAYDISKAERMLGYKPSQDIAGEVNDIIASYRKNGDLPSLVA